MRQLRLVAIVLAAQLGCNSLSDPAVRLAYCLEGAIKAHARDGATFNASCDLKMSGSYLVVLHPEGELSDEQLVSAGMPRPLLAELRALRIGDRPAVYVIAADPAVSGTGAGRSSLSSRTTYQNNFVRIARLMVVAKTTQPVGVEIGGPPDARVIEGIR